MAARRPHTAYTAEDLVRKLPGWKPAPVAATEDGEPAAAAHDEPRVPLLPDFHMSKQFDFASKNATDTMRLQQMEEIQSIRDYLAKTGRGENKDKQINIPLMKTFERAILMPEEYQRKTTSYPTGQYPYAADHKDRRYPTYGEFLMENPFAKKKKKKKGKKKKK